MMNPVDPQTPLTITMTAQEWNFILNALHDAPYRVARPLIDKMTAQFEAEKVDYIPKSNGEIPNKRAPRQE